MRNVSKSEKRATLNGQLGEKRGEERCAGFSFLHPCENGAGRACVDERGKSPWFRSLVQELAIIIYGGHSTCTQKPGMPRSVESRPLGDDRGGHWPRMIKRRENLAEITGNVRYRFEKKKKDIILRKDEYKT